MMTLNLILRHIEHRSYGRLVQAILGNGRCGLKRFQQRSDRARRGAGSRLGARAATRGGTELRRLQPRDNLPATGQTAGGPAC